MRYYPDYRRKRPALASCQAGPQGEFELSYRKSEVVEGVERPQQWKETTIVAEAPGFGLQWAEWQEIDPSKPLALTARADDFPIHGRIVDLEGRPVAGVRVILQAIDGPKDGSLDAWLAAIRLGAVPWISWSKLGRSLPQRDEDSPPPAITDRDGRFVLNGIGPERVANLELRGDMIAYKAFKVATRTMSPVMEGHMDMAADRSPVFGADFRYQAYPSDPIVGIVRDAASGKPLAKVGVESWKFADEQYSAVRRFAHGE